MPGATTNFGFEYPLNTDPLADGAQEIQNFAETADTTFVDLLGGTTDQYLAKNSNTNMDFKWVTFPSDIPGGAWTVPSGRYFGVKNAMEVVAIQGRLTSYQQVRFVPVIVPEAMTVDRIAIECTTAVASQVARLGIYNADATTRAPSTLVLDAGTVSVGTTGIKEITISQALNAGLYYLCFVTQTTSGTASFNACNSGTDGTTRYGSRGVWTNHATNTAYFNTLSNFTYTQNSVTGALPATATPVSPGVIIEPVHDMALRRA